MKIPAKDGPTDADALVSMRELVGFLEKGQHAEFESGLVAFLKSRDQGLYVNVAKLTRRVHDAMTEFKIDSQLQSLTGDIPDACSRLDYVVEVTEKAAHKTLDLVEECQSVNQGISRAAAANDDSLDGDSDLAVSTRHDARLAQINDNSELLRAKLTELAQAQEYQDLAGQVIRRVTTLVRGVETSLLDLLRASGTEMGVVSKREERKKGELLGPTIEGVTPAAVSQSDADSLLADLGF